MKYPRPSEIKRIRPGTFFVKFEFEGIKECLGSYCTTEENAKREEVLIGHESKEVALKSGKEAYKNDPDGMAAFEVLNYRLQVVDSFTPATK